jgi:hypothetical protein
MTKAMPQFLEVMMAKFMPKSAAVLRMRSRNLFAQQFLDILWPASRASGMRSPKDVPVPLSLSG